MNDVEILCFDLRDLHGYPDRVTVIGVLYHITFLENRGLKHSPKTQL